MKDAHAGKQSPDRFTLNAPGDFYTCGECLACEAPEAEAPDLLAPLGDDNITTYFVRQPSTPEEVVRACNAVRVCCVQDLRYGGTDIEIVRRLGNDANHSDYVEVEGALRFVGRPPQRPWYPPQPTGWQRLAAWLRR